MSNEPANPNLLDRETFLSLAPQAGQVIAVDVPELGTGRTIGIRVLSGDDADRVVGIFRRDDGDENAEGESAPDRERHTLVAFWIMCVCDCAGEALFTREDSDYLLTLPLALLKRVGQRAMELNGISETASEETAKN